MMKTAGSWPPPDPVPAPYVATRINTSQAVLREIARLHLQVVAQAPDPRWTAYSIPWWERP